MTDNREWASDLSIAGFVSIVRRKIDASRCGNLYAERRYASDTIMISQALAELLVEYLPEQYTRK